MLLIKWCGIPCYIGDKWRIAAVATYASHMSCCYEAVDSVTSQKLDTVFTCHTSQNLKQLCFTPGRLTFSLYIRAQLSPTECYFSTTPEKPAARKCIL